MRLAFNSRDLKKPGATVLEVQLQRPYRAADNEVNVTHILGITRIIYSTGLLPPF
jgi:hypothetical protein